MGNKITTTVDSADTQTSKVIDMKNFRDGPANMSPLRQAEAYWTALRHNGDVPRRSDVDPRGLRNILEYAFVLERVAPGIARFRLAGQHLIALAGMEVRGMPMTAFFQPESRARIAEIMEETFSGPAVSELSLHGEARYGRPACDGHMILLPLRGDQGAVNRLLGVVVTDGGKGHAPTRFEIVESQVEKISGLRPMRPLVPAQAPVDTAGFAEPVRPLSGKRPYLRLVK